MKLKKGFFITLEGGEATGKTTQIYKIKNWLKKNKIPYTLTREPGGTKISESLRKIILSSKLDINVSLEVLLLMASRMDHLNKIILPSLKKGKIVICDRYVDSTAVYQGYLKKFGIKEIYKLHKKYLNNILPILTFYFYLDFKTTNLRLKKRHNKNKYDLIDKKFHNNINKGYLKIAKNNRRFKIINASNTKDDINFIIIKNIKNILKKNGIQITKN